MTIHPAPARRRQLIVLLLTLLGVGSLPLCALELPPIQVFTTDSYHGGTQNWMLGQDGRNFLYAANNEGLLSYDGHRWQLHPSPGGTIVRSVRAHDGRVYTGSYMEFGYWDRGAGGYLGYHSLSQAVADDLLPDEQFWNILPYEDVLVFQSLQGLHFYHPEDGTIHRLRPANGVSKVFRVDRELYFSSSDGSLFRLESGQPTPVLAGAEGAPTIIHLWRRAGELLAVTATRGVVRIRDGRLSAVVGYASLDGKRAYTATSLRDGGLAVGTISHGVLIFGADQQRRYQINQLRGLSNNTILSLYESSDGNLWVGADNGINCINLPSPFRKYTDNSGELGTIHASARRGDLLYLGSNQGLFVRSIRGAEDYRLIPGTRGQVWSLRVYEGTLFCGHDAGTLLVEGERVRKIYPDGTWTFEPVPGHPQLLLAGHYSGISVLERTDGRWTFRNRIAGCDYSVRFLALTDARTAYFSHEYRGVFALELDPDLRRVRSLELLDRPAKWPHAGLTEFQDSIYYLSGEGLFAIGDTGAPFRPAGFPERTVGPAGYTSGRMTAAGNRLWYFDRYGIHYLEHGAVSGELQRRTIPVPAPLLNAKLGYENITSVGRDTLLIGTADGYLLLDLTAVPPHRHELYLTGVTMYDEDGTAYRLPLDQSPDIAFRRNQLRFDLAIPTYDKFFVPYYQHRLTGTTEAWSEWTTEAEINYPDLPVGEYELEVRSLLGRQEGRAAVSYTFTILPPWYLSWPALLLYVTGILLLATAFHRGYTRYYRRQREQLERQNAQQLAAREREAELEMSRVRNEQLQQDIEAKSREMASNTMSLVKKNELLQRIKDALLSSDAPTVKTQRVMGIIDDNLNEAETWALFQVAFEQADRDFFRTVKARHPDLSPNDLRLCAYLRLNLSTKEIAPMLNISVRSVEVKRYRLRKRLNLDREVNLTDYIMSL